MKLRWREWTKQPGQWTRTRHRIVYLEMDIAQSSAWLGHVERVTERPNTYRAVLRSPRTVKPFVNVKRAKAWLKREACRQLAAVAQKGRAA